MLADSRLFPAGVTETSATPLLRGLIGRNMALAIKQQNRKGYTLLRQCGVVNSRLLTKLRR